MKNIVSPLRPTFSGIKGVASGAGNGNGVGAGPGIGARPGTGDSRVRAGGGTGVGVGVGVGVVIGGTGTGAGSSIITVPIMAKVVKCLTDAVIVLFSVSTTHSSSIHSPSI